MATLSLALICRDEEPRLPGWLEANAGVAEEIVAVDSGSGDATVGLLEEAGAKVTVNTDWQGYTHQRNLALAQCTGDYVLFLDADEQMDAELAQALAGLKAGPAPAAAGWELSYRVHFFGHPLRHGGFGNERHLRLIRRGQGRWVGDGVHERMEAEGPIARLPGRVRHYSYDTVAQYLARMVRYSGEAAGAMHARGKQVGPLGAWGHGAWAFFSRYILRAGFLDGWAGYLAARLEGQYTLAKYAQLIEMEEVQREP